MESGHSNEADVSMNCLESNLSALDLQPSESKSTEERSSPAEATISSSRSIKIGEGRFERHQLRNLPIFNCGVPPRKFCPDRYTPRFKKSRPFTKFANLPTEIRLMIWRLLLLESRIVGLEMWHGGRVKYFNPTAKHLHPSTQEVNDRTTKRQDPTRTSGPVTLRINRESREETLTYYFPLFYGSNMITPIYFSPKQDIFLMPSPYQLKRNRDSFLFEALGAGNYWDAKDQLSEIKSVVVPQRVYYWQTEHVIRILGFMKGIREIIISFGTTGDPPPRMDELDRLQEKYLTEYKNRVERTGRKVESIKLMREMKILDQRSKDGLAG